MLSKKHIKGSQHSLTKVKIANNAFIAKGITLHVMTCYYIPW